jgi:hypothetical protein
MEAAMALGLQLRSPRAGLDERVEESREEALAVAGSNLTGGGVRRCFQVRLLFALLKAIACDVTRQIITRSLMKVLRSPSTSRSPHIKSSGAKGLRHKREIYTREHGYQLSGRGDHPMRAAPCNRSVVGDAFRRSRQYLYVVIMSKAPPAPSRNPMPNRQRSPDGLASRCHAYPADQLQLVASLNGQTMLDFVLLALGVRLLHPIDRLRFRLRTPLTRAPMLVEYILGGVVTVALTDLPHLRPAPAGKILKAAF